MTVPGRSDAARLASPDTTAAEPVRPQRRSVVVPWTVAAVAVVAALVSVGALALTRADRGAAGGGDGPFDDESPRIERGFASPEAAVEYLAERVAAGDLGGALEAFAVESMVEGYSFEVANGFVEAVSPVSWLPASSPGYRALDADLRRGDAATQVLWLVRQVTAPDLDVYVMVELDDEQTASDVAAALAPEGLTGLTVRRVDELHPALRGDTDPFAVWAEAYGADEMRELAVLYETPGGTAVGGARVLRYGREWYLWDLSSAVLGTASGELDPESELAYLALVASVGG